ncbi:hypothetical protein [Streptomyces silvisoli]|uniref:DUF4232 domain-containing protein n=1 Tax=Streptomyces silvisoli TaxID=3034235 RepID=A0ABT5ZQQ6_9ACTN|nr:hypothetical protein [Streptomyces silvisoli]MDF3292142.1 hypothetical protein [Streptomyces silvisoli]
MGNLRNPVGPLPSSIYWRRRAVVLGLFVLLVGLIVWMLLPGGDSNAGHKGEAQGPGGRTPVPSITPGPTSSQTGITARPGGRDTGGTSSSGGSGGNAGGGGAGGANSGSSGGSSGGGSGSGGNPPPLPADSALPDCASAQVQLKLRSVKNTYDLTDKPKFELTAVNSGGSACKVDFGSTAAVVTIVDGSGHHVWASDDCPPTREAYPLQVPAGGSTSFYVQWDRTLSVPQCASPSGAQTAPSGNYQVKVTTGGIGSAQTTFTLNGGS